MEEENDESKEKKKNERFEITELFMATNGRNNMKECYYGVIRRDKDENGKEISVNCNILIPGRGMVWAEAEDQWKLGPVLDDLVELQLSRGIHDDPGVTSSIAETKFFHN